MEVVWRLGFSVGGDEMRKSSLYKPEAGEGRGRRGIAITSLVEVGGGRLVGEASSLT
jgi:hypothetical protein